MLAPQPVVLFWKVLETLSGGTAWECAFGGYTRPQVLSPFLTLCFLFPLSRGCSCRHEVLGSVWGKLDSILDLELR